MDTTCTGTSSFHGNTCCVAVKPLCRRNIPRAFLSFKHPAYPELEFNYPSSPPTTVFFDLSFRLRCVLPWALCVRVFASWVPLHASWSSKLLRVFAPPAWLVHLLTIAFVDQDMVFLHDQVRFSSGVRYNSEIERSTTRDCDPCRLPACRSKMRRC